MDELLGTAGSTVVPAAIADCSGGSGDDTGSFETLVSDQPDDIADFDTLELTLTELRPKPTDGEEQSVDIEDTTVDLATLVGDESGSLGTTELETGAYEYLKLVVDEVLTATLSEGGDAEVTTPGEAPLKFNAGSRSVPTARRRSLLISRR